MKKNNLELKLQSLLKNNLIIMLFLAGLLCSCKDEPTTIFTFKKEMMGAYLENRPDEFSEFKKLLDTTEVLGLVNTYGKYTLFAPTNEAMFKYYELKGKHSLRDFQADTLKKIAYDHLIKDYAIKTENFIDGLLPYSTMSDRFVSVSSRLNNNAFFFYINNNSAILKKDIEVSNGIIHEIDHVIDPTLLNIVQAIASNPRFSILAKALKETHLVDSLKLTRDYLYNPKDYNYIQLNWQGGGSKDEIPLSRKYGYTALLESDETLKKYGINSYEDLKAYAEQHVYTGNNDEISTDVTDRRNPLNMFMAYHLIERKITATKFIDAYDCDHMLKQFDMYEYIETMCPNTLIEIKKERSSGETNLINKSRETGDAIRIIAKDSDAINGVYHEIDKMLIYDNKAVAEMSTKRIRMDGASFFSEITNNNMRYYDKKNPRSWVFPPNYIKRLTCTKDTRFCYLNACDGYLDYQGDEIFLAGMYEFSMITPPVPAGTYEVRFGYQPTAWRGAAQLYWDGVPCGIPLDLRISASDPLIGYIEPGTDSEDLVGLENDKMMRNRGYMKGPNTYKAPVGYGQKIARQSNAVLRRVLGTYKFDKAQNHVFKVKAVRSGQFMMDFLEFVPVEMLETEGID